MKISKAIILFASFLQARPVHQQYQGRQIEETHIRHQIRRHQHEHISPPTACGKCRKLIDVNCKLESSANIEQSKKKAFDAYCRKC